MVRNPVGRLAMSQAAQNAFIGLCGLLVCGCGNGGGASGAPDGATAPRDLSTAAATDGISAGDLATANPLDMAVASDAAAPDLTMSTGLALPANQVAQRYFPDGAPWYKNVAGDLPAADSAAITQWMLTDSPPNGWGTGHMQIDFSLIAIDVPQGTPKISGIPVDGFFYTPDCDTAPIPLPTWGIVEGNDAPLLSGPLFSGYQCGGFANGDDCHILLVARSEQRLYEIYHGTYDSVLGFQTGCLAIWDTSKVDPNGRGQQCTSADAAGFPLSPLLFTPEEIASGTINHAIRLILPNAMIRRKTYVAPATHGTNTSGPITSGPYGFRMRLSANYPINTLSAPAQVIAKAMQQYGMLLSDGGNIAITAQSDALSSTKYSDLGLDSHALFALKSTDFDVVEDSPTVDVTDDCERTPIAQ